MKVLEIKNKMDRGWRLKFNEKILFYPETMEEIEITESCFNSLLSNYELTNDKNGFRLKGIREIVLICNPLIADSSKIKKPWGYYTDFVKKPNYKIKEITVYPKQRLSLQSHEDRDESWLCVSGAGIAEINGSRFALLPSGVVFIQAGEKHRLINNSDEPLIINETWFGNSNEQDIVRYEDDYGRK